MKRKLLWGVMLLAALALVPMHTAITAAAAQKSIDETRAVKPDGVVQISNVAGSVRVVSWEKSEVRLSGELEENVERVDFEVRDGRTSIRVVVREHSHGDAAAYLTVSAPAASSIEADAVSADIHVEDAAPPELERPMRQSVYARSVSGEVGVNTWASAVEIRSVSGDVTFSGAAETLDAETVSGNIQCAGAHSADVRTISGDVKVANADSVRSKSTSGDLTASNIGRAAEVSSISGDVQMTLASMNKVSARTVSGDVTMEGALAPAGRVTASTQSGGVEISFPPDVSAEFEISSMSGHVRTGFGFKSEGINRSLNFALGTGDGYVRISTTSGDVSINKL
ncbi:MAG: DUF4097 family beta strand repeat-containing protein [Candidatus Hydrogenedentes bacterium]|nr:DUF4097 family beta strand repeat-containing protein [Candidatus Hydrogenedentota bacterium]